MAEYLATNYLLWRDDDNRNEMLSQNTRLMILACLLSGCAVGPNYIPAEEPEDSPYTLSPLPEKTVNAPVFAGESQQFLFGEAFAGCWWTFFQSEKLNQVVEEALQVSPTIVSAEAKLRHAAEMLRADIGGFFPQLDLNGTATKYEFLERTIRENRILPTVPDINTLKLYNASVDVSYHFDIFGKTRRQVEASQANVDYERSRLQAAQLTLAANVVTAAFKEALYRKQKEVTQTLIELQANTVAIMKQQFELGGLAYLDLIAQEGQFELTQARLPEIERGLEQIRHQLAVYLGQLPGEACVPTFELEEFILPIELPVILPSQLIHKRPDILASEAQLHQAMANIGVATANLFPQINVSAGYGPLLLDASPFFNFHAWVLTLAASASQPLFHGGTLLAERQAAIADAERASADYFQTVLQAFQDVADVLKALEYDAKELRSYTLATLKVEEALRISRRQLELGGISYLSLLETERQYFEAILNLAQAQANRFADTAALFQALGG